MAHRRRRKIGRDSEKGRTIDVREREGEGEADRHRKGKIERMRER